GVAGNTIALADGMGTFSWAGSTLGSGADGQPSIVALNKLYSGPSVAASATGTVTASFSSNDFTGGETVAIFKSPTTLNLNASPPTSKTQVGTFNTVAGSGNVVVGGVTITNGGIAATIKGTVSSTPSGTITLTVGSNTVTLTAFTGTNTEGKCTGAAPNYTGQYSNVSTNINQNASAIANAITACFGLGATALQSASDVNVTASTLGSVSLSGTNDSTRFTWATATTGSNGTTACGTTTG